MIKDLRKKTDIELGELISKLKIQLLEMRFKIANGEIEGLHKISEIKKTIAMAMTVLTERKIKISFATHSIQLISNNNGKQEIKTIKLTSFINEVKEVKSQQNNTNLNKENNQSKQQNNFNNNSKPIVNNNSNIANTPSSKHDTVQIRRSAKG